MKRTTPIQRTGSVIIYCIALSAIIVVIGYGFLRSTMHATVAGDASQLNQYAQSAARQGMNRAIEAIIDDYQRATLQVAQGSTISTISVPAVTFLDGPFRAPFQSYDKPNQLEGSDWNGPNRFDDVSTENQLTISLIPWAGGSEDPRRYRWHSESACMIYDGRGKYFEPGYENISRPTLSGPASQPVDSLRFSNFAAAIPERDEGLFLDSEFVRVDTGNPQSDRLVAKYRLRYAVGVEDLGGHILANPYAEGDFDYKNGNPAYRHPPAWMEPAQHAYYNYMKTIRGGLTAPLRAEHLFLGRGNTSNVDRLSGSGSLVTFPNMFRHRLFDNGKPPYWGLFALTRSRDQIREETDGLYPVGSITGGTDIPAVSAWNKPITSIGIGQQVSWYNFHSNMMGAFGKWETDADYYGSQAIDDEFAKMVPSLYGRRLQKSAGLPQSWKWYEGRVETPFYINLLTATPRTINAMMMAYLPPAVKSIEMTREYFYMHTGLDNRQHDTWGSPLNNTTVTPNKDYFDIYPGIPASAGGRDLFTSITGPAFNHYAPPSADGITPNFQKPDTRSVNQRYPGRLWNENDDLGKDINIETILPTDKSRCSHTKVAFFSGFTAEKTVIKSQGTPITTPVPSPWGSGAARAADEDPEKDKVVYKPDPAINRYKYQDSYWWDLVSGFSATVAITRAAWTQYPNAALNPYDPARMDSALHDPQLFNTLEGVDRLFLNQMGESFYSPGDGNIASIINTFDFIANKSVYSQINTKSTNNISTLATSGKLTPDQANVLERVLNDMRMSFFGASPQYSETFRPLDFSGDGKVHASCYSPVGDPDALDKGIAWWRAAEGAGRGPTPEYWFTTAGCFYIGKSHYYRIFTRGEVWDNVRSTTVADATLESVLCVDPDGTGDMSTNQILFQKWHYNRYTGEMSRQSD